MIASLALIAVEILAFWGEIAAESRNYPDR